MNRKLILNELLSRRTFVRWVVSALSLVGAMAAIAGLIDALFPNVLEPKGWIYLSIIFTTAAIWATYKAWPRLQHTRYFPNLSTSISIEVGDLFEQKGHLIIGMTDTFDTELPHVIKDSSVQGQLLVREYNNDLAKLDCEIKQALQDIEVVALETAQTKPKGKRERYPIGTVITLGSVQRYYYCCAYSHMSNALVAQATPESLWLGMAQVWEAVRNTAQHDTVSIPIVGSGLAKLSSQLSRTDLLRLIILSFMAASRQRIVTKHLRIIIYTGDAQDITVSECIDTLIEV